jgi:hypothetical protein
MDRLKNPQTKLEILGLGIFGWPVFFEHGTGRPRHIQEYRGRGASGRPWI